MIGGGVATAGEILFTPLARHLSSYATLPFTRHLALTPAHLATNAGLVGAAALARPTLPTP